MNAPPRRTVLVVEDEYFIALDLRDVLEANGWRVIGPAANMRAALQCLEMERPMVALLDVNLGHELVTPVADALNRLAVPFAVASAYLDVVRVAGEAFADVVNVGKPADIPLMLAVLGKLAGPVPPAETLEKKKD